MSKTSTTSCKVWNWEPSDITASWRFILIRIRAFKTISAVGMESWLEWRDTAGWCLVASYYLVDLVPSSPALINLLSFYRRQTLVPDINHLSEIELSTQFLHSGKISVCSGNFHIWVQKILNVLTKKCIFSVCTYP